MIFAHYMKLDHIKRDVPLCLLGSQNDIYGHRAARTWGCVCPSGPSISPYLAAEHAELLQPRFNTSIKFVEDCCLPLFPDEFGGVVEKVDVIDVIKYFVRSMDSPLVGPGGEELYGGHRARIGGAVFLAGLGVTVVKIQFLVWWQSSVVERYVALAPHFFSHMERQI